jgi:hypothetical protein
MTIRSVHRTSSRRRAGVSTFLVGIAILGGSIGLAACTPPGPSSRPPLPTGCYIGNDVTSSPGGNWPDLLFEGPIAGYRNASMFTSIDGSCSLGFLGYLTVVYGPTYSEAESQCQVHDWKNPVPLDLHLDWDGIPEGYWACDPSS